MQLFGWKSGQPDASLEEGKGEASAESDGSWGGSWFAKAQEDPWMPSLTRTQRVMGFIMCLCAGGFCFSVAAMLIPILILRARKFAVLYSMGSMFIVGSFAFLWGPYSLLKHLASPSVLPYSGLYAANMAATLYCGMSLHSTILTIIFAGLQIFSLLYFVLSYIPGGTAGFMFMGRMAGKAASTAVSAVM